MAKASAHSEERCEMFIVVAKRKDTGVTMNFKTFKVRAEADRYARDLNALPNVTAEIVEGQL